MYFLHFGTLKVRYQLICLLRSARTNQLGHFDLLLKDYWNLLVLIWSRPVNAPFILLLRPFGIRFQTASVTYIRFFSSKSNLKLIFFVRLFWIHRCNLFVFIVCALWVLLKILRLIRTLHYYYYFYYVSSCHLFLLLLKWQSSCVKSIYLCWDIALACSDLGSNLFICEPLYFSWEQEIWSSLHCLVWIKVEEHVHAWW